MSPRTVRNYRDAANTLFAFCEARGYLPKGTNPIEGTEAGSKKSKGAITIDSVVEAAALLANAPVDAVPALALCAFAGVRTADWKRKLRTEAPRRYPAIKVTLSTADALLLLNFGLAELRLK